MIQEKLKELELQLNYVCYDKELITRLSKVWDAYYDLKGEVKKLNIPAVIKSVCSCGRREINVLSGICDICWNEKFPDEQTVL